MRLERALALRRSARCAPTHLVRSSVTSAERKRPSAAAAILWGGLMCAVFDIAYAFLFFGRLGARPMRILQSVSSGLLGTAAFRGGAKTAALGLLLHFVISFSAATIYYLASRRLVFMVRNAVGAGL